VVSQDRYVRIRDLADQPLELLVLLHPLLHLSHEFLGHMHRLRLAFELARQHPRPMHLPPKHTCGNAGTHRRFINTTDPRTNCSKPAIRFASSFRFCFSSRRFFACVSELPPVT
jgi:hypothetical protein